MAILISYHVVTNKPQIAILKECIPVGCIPPACQPYLPACTVQGECLLREGVSAPGCGVSAPGGLLPGGGGVSAPGGYDIPACTEADPLPCEQNDRQV